MGRFHFLYWEVTGGTRQTENPDLDELSFEHELAVPGH
jgi:hypothetical protein